MTKIGVKLLARLLLKFSHLHKHKFLHNFKYSVNLICNCGHEIEITRHFFLVLQIPCQWKTKFPWQPLSDRYFIWRISINALLYGSNEFNHKINAEILLRTIYYIKSTKRFEKLLIHLPPFFNLPPPLPFPSACTFL